MEKTVTLSVICWRFYCRIGCRWVGGGLLLQAAVDPLDGVSLILGNDALLNVGVNLLVHEFLQFGQVVIWNRIEHNKRLIYDLRSQRS